jgi:DNA-directed RNA polymerase beta subunit/DNA-directed RNA polymerase beta' subunit
MKTFNVEKQFDEIKKAATDAIGEIFPIDGKIRGIRLERVWVEDKMNPKDFSSQAKVKSAEGTWGAPVYATLVLTDKVTGKTLDRKDKVRLFNLPKLTDRFSYIVNGNEYQVHNQLRLKSGVYTLRKQNGELKTQVNLARGKPFDLAFDEGSGKFVIKKIGGGQANVPLYPILIHLGISPGLIAKTWGSDLEAANRDSDPKALAKAVTAFGIKSGGLKEYFNSTVLNPETTKLTLGESFDKVDGPMLLKSAKDLLDTHLGKKDPADRDSLEFKELHSVDDFIKERITKNKNTLSYKIKRNIDNPKRSKISQIVNPGSFNSVVTSFFTQDDKSATPEQTNPLEMLSGNWKMTIMGSGGITKEHAITNEMRQVHPSHYGFVDPIHTPESGRIGVNLHMPLGAIKDGKTLKMAVVDKAGKQKLLSPGEASQYKIAFPGQTGDKVKAQYQGKIVIIPKSQVDYFTPHPGSLFSWSSNLVPYLPSNQGNRAMMAAKMLEQAISLKHREAPLVQVGATAKTSMEEEIGQAVAATAPSDGVVKEVTADKIVLKTAKGKEEVNLYNNFILNRKSFLNHTSTVKVGDKVKEGQVLADSNYTRGGTLALGTNLRAAYIPYKGFNFEDGIVISESAANKLTSEHIHKKDYMKDDNAILNLTVYTSLYPNTATPENLRKLDKDGVIKKGERVRMGDIIIASLRKRAPSQDIALIHKQLSDRPKDDSVIWNLEDDGIVQSVTKSGNKVNVYIKTEEKAKIGDKLSGRMGNKGIITKILPDSETPHTADGKPVDIMLNPHGVIGRINIGQIYESAAGKAAEKDGKPHKVYNFTGENYLDSTNKLMAKHKISDKEELIDPISKKSLGQVHVGRPYILKLFKQGTANFSVRQGGPGNPYDLNMQPLKAGGSESSKDLDLLTMYSMLSHGARANLREISTTKSDANDEFWKALKSGQMLPAPKSPFVYEKFINYLKASGINVNKEGSTASLSPLTDKQVLDQSSGKIDTPKFYRGKDFQPIKGGFFDVLKLGGFKGTKWGHIELEEPTVNPVFENAVKKITGLGSKFEPLIAGKLHVNKEGTLNSKGDGVTGGKAIEAILKTIDVDEELKILTKKLDKAKGAQLDDLNKKFRYLKALQQFKLKPHDAYIRKHVPVIPPIYRPIYTLPDGNVTSSDVNFLYQNTGVLNTMHKLPVMKLLPDEEKAELREDIYNHVKGLSGLTDLNIKGRAREGFISQIKGGEGQAKGGFFIDKMLSKKQDFVGRGTIIPETDLGVDEMAMPEEMAWKLFEPFVVKELKNHGKNPNQAKEEIKTKTLLARKALEIVMRDRHVLLNRAPSLHKFSIMAFKPQITSGRALKIPPLITRGFNGDFDGDQQIGQVFAAIPKDVIAQISMFWQGIPLEEYTMTARFKEQVPAAGPNDEVFIFNLEEFPHGELIATKEGEKGRIDFFEAIPGTKVLALNEETKAIEWKEVSGWSKHYAREIEIVNLQSGRQIITDNDPRAVYGIVKGTLRFSRFTPDEAKSLKVFVPRADRLTLEDSDNISTLAAKKTADCSERYMYKNIKLDASFGYIVGAMAGNGWVSSENHTSLASSSKEVTEKFTIAIKLLFDGESPEKYTHVREDAKGALGPSEKHTFTNHQLKDTLLPLIGHGARNKHLPPFFLTAPKDFRVGVLAGLMDTDGSISISNGKDKPQLMASYTSASIRLIQEVHLLAATLGIRSRITPTKTPAGEDFWALSFSNIDIKKWNGREMAHQEKLQKLSSAKPNENSSVAARYDIVPISYGLAGHIVKTIGAPRNASKEHKTLYAIFNKAKSSGSVSRMSAKSVMTLITADQLTTHEDGSAWLSIVEQKDLAWDQVESVHKTGIKEDGYDLTVPGHETFMNVDGVILSNTMTVHVPVTEEANEEAKRMLPSANLFKPGTGALMIAPVHEAQLGLYYLSKTPKGRDIINKVLGQKYAIAEILDNKSTSKLLSRLAKELKGGEYGRIVNELKAAGDKYIYESGFTLGLEDLHTFGKIRDKVVTSVNQKAQHAKSPAMLSTINKDGQNLLDKLIEKKLKNKNNPLYDMVESGARGNRGQLRQIIATPLFVSDEKDRIVPSPIKKSYAEGLDAGDYWISLYGARRGMIDRAIQTSLPGGFAKEIMATTLDNVISGEDCGTHDGVQLSITDTNVLDRFLAGNQGGLAHNTMVDSNIVSKLKRTGINSVKVRSPLTCLRPKGTCARCHGLDEHGQVPSVGDNVGAKAGQTLSEPLMQMQMNTFHTGGVAGTGSDVAGYQRISQLLHLPKIVSGAAPLSSITGKITKIIKGLAGGHDVYVNDTKHHVPHGRALKVSEGSVVEKGDALSEGTIKPQDLVKYKGMQPAQEYIVDELQKAYHSQGAPLQRKVFETVVRSLTNTTQVLNNPRNSDYIPGDIIPYTIAKHHNLNSTATINTEETVGLQLASNYGPFRVGHIIEQKDVNLLKTLGHKTITVSREPIQHAPVLKGLTTLPLLKKDWMSVLGFRNLSKAIVEGASQSWKTDLAGYHPIPAFAHGKDFGKGTEGKY